MARTRSTRKPPTQKLPTSTQSKSKKRSQISPAKKPKNKRSATKADMERDMLMNARCGRSKLFNNTQNKNGENMKEERCKNMTRDMMYRSMAAAPRTLTIPQRDRTSFQVSPNSSGNATRRRLRCSPITGAVKSIYECGFTSSKSRPSPKRKMTAYQEFVKKASSENTRLGKQFLNVKAGKERLKAIAVAWNEMTADDGD